MHLVAEAVDQRADPLLGKTYPGRDWNPQDGPTVRLRPGPK